MEKVEVASVFVVSYRGCFVTDRDDLKSIRRSLSCW